MAKRSNKKNTLHSKFYATVSGSNFRQESPGEDSSGYSGGHTKTGRSEREDYNINVAEAHQLAMQNPERAARELAYWKTHAQKNIPRGTPGPAAAEVSEEYRRPRVSTTDVDYARRAERKTSWQSQSGVYQVHPRERKSAGGFISQEASKPHRQWIEQQMQDPKSEFNKDLDLTKARTGRYTSAQRRRLSTYTDALQEGASHQEALQRVRSSRMRETVGRPPERRVATRQTQARAVVAGRRQASGRETKFASVAPQPGELKVGISAEKPPSMDEIKTAFPRISEQEMLQIRQAGIENTTQELLANQKWAHETRRANLLGQKNGRKISEAPDKVTIFTTNLGHPTVSLPSNSLVGQYIIRRRKSIAGGLGVSRSQLRGEFPAAIQDAHIVDIATGASLGIQGRQGVFNTTGYRVGRKASQGYGRSKPLGAQILYDTQSGRPLYDSQGNIRYSEGATRPIDWSTPSLGFRVLMG